MRDRRAVIGVGGAGLVVVLVTLAIAAFGVRRLPAVPELADAPAVSLPGRIAFLRNERDDGCLQLVEGSRRPRTLACPGRDENWSGSVSWTPQGSVALQAHGPYDSITVIVDPDTGQVRETVGPPPTVRVPVREPVPGETSPRTRRSDGVEVQVTGRSSRRQAGEDAAATVTLRFPDRSVREVLRISGPRDYGFVDAQWSPDGAWILVRDSEQRLLVVSADGAVGPRLVADRSGEAAWFIPGHPVTRPS